MASGTIKKHGVTWEVIGERITPGNITATLTKSVDEFDFLLVAIGWSYGQIAELNCLITPLQYAESEPKAMLAGNTYLRFKASFSNTTLTIWDVASTGFDTNGCVRIIGCKII